MRRWWPERIGTIFDQQEIKTRSVATAVSGHSVIVKRVSLPMMTEEELYDRIQSEASQHIPFDIADVNLDYQLLESLDSQMDVLLVAVKKDKILNHTNVLAQAGKTPTVVDIDAFALQNCYEVNYDPDPSQTVALLNIGASVMNINIVRGGVAAVYARRFGGRKSIYRRAAERTGPELRGRRAAEEGRSRGRRGRGASRHDSALGFRHPDPGNSEDFRFLPGHGERRKHPANLLAGGTARVPGLVDLLREEFALPVEELYPFRKIVINPGRHNEDQVRELAPRLAIAVGLALRSFDTP